MGRIYFDGPNVLWRCLLQGKDEEFGRDYQDPSRPDKKVWVNGWQHGYDNALTLIHTALTHFNYTPKDVVMVFEGMGATAVRTKRVGAESGYKGSRGKRPDAAYKEYARCKQELEKFLHDLGACSVVQDRVEADDILAYLAEHAQEHSLIYTHDGDLMRLVGTNAHGALISVGNNDTINKNPFGDFPFDLITVYKALVGDNSDNIKGAPGFGDAAFLKVLGTFGLDGLYQIEELIVKRELHRLTEDVADCPVLKKLVEGDASVYKSYTLASLYAGDVDTRDAPLRWNAGLVRDFQQGDDVRYRKWYGTRMLVHQGNLKEALARIERIRAPEVFLDLETTVPEKADEWLEDNKRRDNEVRVDVFGSEIVSCGITLGDNYQNTFYFTHRHLDEEGITQLTKEQLKDALTLVTKNRTVICHNANFELCVTKNYLGDIHASH